MVTGAIAIVAYSIIGAASSPAIGSGALTVDAGATRFVPLSSGTSVGLGFDVDLSSVAAEAADPAGRRVDELAPIPETIGAHTTAVAAETLSAAGAGVETVDVESGVPTASAEPEPEPTPGEREAPEPAPSPAPPPPPAPAPPAEPAQSAPPPAPAVIAVHASTAAPPTGSAEDAIATFFLDVFDEALAVATCESGLDPGAISSGGGNHGLFQINNVHQAAFEAATGTPFDPGVYDPYLNAQFARQLYDGSGWEPWACQS